MKLNPICFPKQEFRFENEGERDFEKERTDEIPYTNLCSLFDVTLSIRASLLFSLCLCYVCVLTLFFCVSAFFFFLSLFSFFFFSCGTLSIYREIPKKLFSYFLSTNQLMEQFASVFPQLLILCSAVPHYFHFSDSWQVTPLLLRCGVL